MENSVVAGGADAGTVGEMTVRMELFDERRDT